MARRGKMPLISTVLFWLGWVLIIATPICSGLLVNITVAGGYQQGTAMALGAGMIVLGLAFGLSLLSRSKSITLLSQCRDELERIRVIAEMDDAQEEEEYEYPSAEMR